MTYNRKGSIAEPFLLVCKFVLLRAEAWEQGTISVTALDGYLIDVKFWFCVFHSRYSYRLNNYFVGQPVAVMPNDDGSSVSVQPS